MKYGEYDTDDLIAALATPWGESAIAVIRTSGDGCIEAFSPLFRSKKSLENAEGYTMHYGTVINPFDSKPLDEVVAGIYRKPKSYTGQDMVEIFCHGSMPGITGILELLRKNSFRDASPGEFTLRAFLNGKIDLTRAEAVNEIIRAKSGKAMELALGRLSGAVFERINSIKEMIKEVLAQIELQLDYAEDEADPDASLDTDKIEKASGQLEQLASTYRIGKVIQEGVKVVLAGKTNAGKSSLFNLLNRMERSIVSDYHGTTRDYIESYIIIGGIPVKLYDTAGLRDSENPVEALGIKKSSALITGSDIILYLVDGSEGLTPEDLKFLESFRGRNLLKIWNKSDISREKAPEGFIPVSAVNGDGIGDIEKAITTAAEIGSMDLNDSAVIDSERQRKLIGQALESLENCRTAIASGLPLDVIAFDIREVLDCLGEITGEVTTADILETMFSRFCVGK